MSEKYLWSVSNHERLTPHDGLNKRIRSVPVFPHVGVTRNVTGLYDVKPRPCILFLSQILYLLRLAEQVFVSRPRTGPPTPTSEGRWSLAPLPKTVGVSQRTGTQRSMLGTTSTSNIRMGHDVTNQQKYCGVRFLVVLVFPYDIRYTRKELLQLSDSHSTNDPRQTTG